MAKLRLFVPLLFLLSLSLWGVFRGLEIMWNGGYELTYSVGVPRRPSTFTRLINYKAEEATRVGSGMQAPRAIRSFLACSTVLAEPSRNTQGSAQCWTGCRRTLSPFRSSVNASMAHCTSTGGSILLTSCSHLRLVGSRE